MRVLFTAVTSHIDPDKDTGCGDRLTDALHKEFPAYYVSEWIACDFVAAFVVSSFKDDAPIPAHLNGWGHGPLTLRLVA